MQDSNNIINGNVPPPGENGDGVVEPMADAGEASVTQEQMEEVQRELDDVKTRLLRVAADYQNYVKRSASAVEEARKYQLVEATKPMLAVLDLFDKALKVDLEKTSAAALLEGMTLVRAELLKRLGELGVKVMEVKTGDAFNPEHHEAMLHQQVEGLEAHHVAAVFEPGYMLGERVLRPAKVSVTG